MRNILFIIILLFLGSCKETFFETEPATNAEAVFEELWQKYDEMYALFDEREVDWEALYAEFRLQLNNQSTDDDLYHVLTQMLAKLNDGHVTLTAANREVFFSNQYFREKIDDGLFDEGVIKSKYLNRQFKEYEHSYYGLVNNSIPYIHFGVVNFEWEHLQDAIQQKPDASGIIIDLRHNQGGDFTFALQQIEKINNERRLVFQSRTKNGPGKNDFTAWFDWYLEAKGNYNGKIIVLIDRYTVSAGERATLILKSMPNVTLVGESTNGSISTMIAQGLSNGWYCTVAPQDVIAFNGEIYESRGIPADILVKNSPENLAQGKDDVLERALDMLQ